MFFSESIVATLLFSITKLFKALTALFLPMLDTIIFSRQSTPPLQLNGRSLNTGAFVKNSIFTCSSYYYIFQTCQALASLGSSLYILPQRKYDRHMQRMPRPALFPTWGMHTPMCL